MEIPAGGAEGMLVTDIMTWDETFDVGVDTRTPVDDRDYQVPFRFTGKIDKVTFKLGPTQLTAEDHKVMERALARANDEASEWKDMKGCSGPG